MKKIFLLGAITLFALASCDLTEEPKTSLTPDVALGTFDGLDEATATTYAALRSEGWYGSYMSLMPDVMCGNAVAGDPINTGRGMMFNNWLFTADGGWSMWGNGFTTIYWCNNVIFRINTDAATYLAEDGVTQQDLDNILGELLFMRAFSYFDLVRWYGPRYTEANANALAVPIVSEDPDVSSVAKPARETMQTVYDYIVADLTKALDIMDPTYIRAGVADTKATCTTNVIKALLARVYLYIGNYEGAEQMASQVISSGQYNVVEASQYNSVWTADNWSGTSEIIFSVYSALSEGSISNPNGMLTDPNDGYGDIRVSQDWMSLFDNAPDDVRFTGLTTSERYSGYYWPSKYRKTGAIGYSNIPIIRISEMYLIRAEARLALNNTDGALSDLNYVPNRRNGATYDFPTIDNIFTENRKEFAFEGHIYHDYKRTGRSVERVDQITGVANPNVPADSYLWQMPISTSERDVNPNLEQNPGY